MAKRRLTSSQLKGKALEKRGKRVFSKMGLTCIGDLNHVHLSDLDNSYSKRDKFELDYLIPEGKTCLVGEITARSNPSAVRSKHKAFRKYLSFLKNIDKGDHVWTELGVPNDKLAKFSDIDTIKGIFITTKLEMYDVNLTSVPDVTICYGVDCELIEGYADTIGEYAKNHFLNRVGIETSPSIEALTVREDDHNLSRMRHKKVASGDVPVADVYTFEVDPYLLLPMAQVYRRDDFPGIASGKTQDYQRPLDEDKIDSMRRILRANLDFMFPNNILCVLSDNCTFSDGELQIPKAYGSISVIDGQHRLFSFADPDINKHLESPKIMMTAIKFRNLDPDKGRKSQINKYSAKTFVEINNEQTSVSGNHLDFIKYDILDDRGRRALAAKVILNVNKRRGKALFGLFDTHQTGLGVITPRVVISGLQVITNISANIEPVVDAERGSKLDKKQGYEKLLDSDIGQLTNPDILITKCTVCLERYFNHVSNKFSYDWPARNSDKETSLAYAKVFHAFVKLLKYFIFNGYDWKSVNKDLVRIKRNLIRLCSLDAYRVSNYAKTVAAYKSITTVSRDNLSCYRLFDPAHPDIPSARPKKGESYEFLKRNRISPTSIQTIVEERIRSKLNK